MRARNRKHKPKHWTKPKWHKRILLIKIYYVLKTTFMKEKTNIRGFELRKKIINTCFF